MDSKYLIVDKAILPDYYDKVVAARRMLEEGTAGDISEAVRTVGISRSTYYKYKDCVMELSAKNTNKRAIISMMLRHEAGTLEALIAIVASHSYSIWTINQSPPVNGQATVVMALDMTDATGSIDRLIGDMRAMEGVRKVNLIGIE